MASQKRIQLTLFLDIHDSQAIEEIRKTFNPSQYKLIKSHVTLCREDELLDLECIKKNILNCFKNQITLEFGKPTRFSEDYGVLLPSVGENSSFHALRRQILSGLINQPRLQEPHITLMHPGNSSCTYDIFNHIKNKVLPTHLTFKEIHLIEQVIGYKWQTLERFELPKV